MKNEKKLEEKWQEYGLDYAKDHEKDNPIVNSEFNEIFKLYTPRKNEKLLEIGCNTGEFCWLLEQKYDILPDGIDINAEAIKIAKEKYPNLNFQVMNLFDLDKKYDVIYMQHVIEHLKSSKKAILKLNDLLNPGGKLIISCPNNWAYTSKLMCGLKKQQFYYDPTHVHEFNPDELSKKKILAFIT
jgi:2-polyprenyl-3-methyl-5-hydroxy-6-metoxy-1,4-benzoquinol methylase